MPRLATLNSWKEIADYLGRSVRTVQRWEARYGLPVRHRAGKRTSVFALEAELDSWLQTRSKFRTATHELHPGTYELLFQCLPVAMGVVNDRRDWMDANPAMCELVDRTKPELKRIRLDDLFVENDRGSLPAAWDTMLASGTASTSVLLRGGRRPRWVECHFIARVVPGVHLVVLATSRELLSRIGETADDPTASY
jgi:PAS domain-containing protein